MRTAFQDCVQPTLDKLTLFANFGGSINRDEILFLRNMVRDLSVLADVNEANRRERDKQVVGWTIMGSLAAFVIVALLT